MKSSDFLVLRPRRVESHQFFREWFADACVRAGARVHFDFDLPWNVKLVLGKLGLCFPLFCGKKLLVLSGGRPEYFAWPWCYFHEIVPVVWDCWPKYRLRLVRFVQRNRVRTIFCTSSQTADFVRAECPNVNAVWLPEGIDVNSYPCGPRLADRPVDILEMGRVMPKVHDAINQADFGRSIKHLYPQGKLLFPDFDSLTKGMRDSKIGICYPRCDTHPEIAGNVETMTQRYWEFMLSGTLIAGRAPRELVEFCGYNPVVELNDHPVETLKAILEDPARYQVLVDRNRMFAVAQASWDSRMAIIKEHLK